MDINSDRTQPQIQQQDSPVFKERQSIPSLKHQLQSQIQGLQQPNIEQQYKNKIDKMTFKQTKQIQIQEDKNQGQNYNQQEYYNLQCSHAEHQNPIQMVILDPNLKKNQRLLCSTCIAEHETNCKTVGYQKAIVMTEENYQKKKEYRDIIVNQNYKELEQLKNNFIQIKSYINKNLDQMIQNTEMWMNDLQNYKSQGYNFYDEIDWLTNHEQKIEIEQITKEIKSLNMKWIQKLEKKLEQFSQFAEYQSCLNLLKSLKHEKNSQEKEKQKKQLKLQDTGKKSHQRGGTSPFLTHNEHKYNYLKSDY